MNRILAKPAQPQWTADACPDAQGFWTIRPNDGTEHGDTEMNPVATVHAEKSVVELICAAPETAAERDALRVTLKEIAQLAMAAPRQRATADYLDAILKKTGDNGELCICDDCGAQVSGIIGCPDGAEICPECFAAGRH